MSLIKIVECTRCKSPQVFKPTMKDDEIPVALEIELNGGYGMFVDNWARLDEYNLLLCHKCAHEFCGWIGINLGNGHPKTEDTFCNGWTYKESLRKELATLEEDLKDLIYINEDTMIVPFDDYPQRKARIESMIALVKTELEGLK